MERLIVWHRWCPPAEAGAEAVAQASLWRIQARERLLALGGETVAELGGTIVVALDPGRAVEAVEACLRLSYEVEQEENLEVGSVAHSLTMGALERAQPSSPLVGDAIDRAEALSAYASAGEVVLDQAAQAAVSPRYLFSGELRAGISLTGALLDRRFPHRARCADALLQLQPPAMSTTAQLQYEQLRRLASGHGRQRVILVGSAGSGVSAWLSHLHQELAPATWLNVRGLGAGFAPLSALRYALARLAGATSLETVLSGADEPDRHALATLKAVREGAVAARRDATMALRQYVGRSWERTGKRALITVNPVPLIDPATLSVVAEVAREGGPDCLVIMRVLPDGRPPEAFTRGGALAELRVPTMSQAEARAFALAMLGRGTPADIARRAALAGGTLPLGVAEAVRVMVSAGDIVPDETGFRWRRGPAGPSAPTPSAALLEERIEGLPEDTRRVLEVLAWAPDPGEADLVQDVALLDGMAEQALARAVEELVQKGLVQRAGEGDLWVSHSVRNVVLSGMSPLRTSDLSLRLAGALSRRCTERSLFARADVAFYLARGGRPQSAVDTLLEAAMAAAQHGFVRSGVRLAAAAVECNPSAETRQKAAAIAQSLGRTVQMVPTSAGDAAAKPAAPEAPASTPEALGVQAMEQAVAALRTRDFERLERALELMVAAGRDGPHIERIRALAQLEKGDLVSAAQLLSRAGAREGAEPSPRTRLARALWRLHSQGPQAAVREALQALQQARQADRPGAERAILLTLSALYARLGLAAQADQLAQRAALPGGAVSGSSRP